MQTRCRSGVALMKRSPDLGGTWPSFEGWWRRIVTGRARRPVMRSAPSSRDEPSQLLHVIEHLVDDADQHHGLDNLGLAGDVILLSPDQSEATVAERKDHRQTLFEFRLVFHDARLRSHFRSEWKVISVCVRESCDLRVPGLRKPVHWADGEVGWAGRRSRNSRVVWGAARSQSA